MDKVNPERICGRQQLPRPSPGRAGGGWEVLWIVKISEICLLNNMNKELEAWRSNPFMVQRVLSPDIFLIYLPNGEISFLLLWR